MSLYFFPNIQLGSPWWLLLLLLLPVLMLWHGKRGGAPAMAFPGVAFLRGLGTAPRSRFGRLSFNLLHLSLLSAIIAMARPQQISSYNEIRSEGIGICVAFDVSLSMLIRDYNVGGKQVNRITAAKRVLTNFINGRPNDRIGIVAFAGAPYNPCPLTLDHEWLLQNMDRIQTGIMEDGTAIGSGLAMAARRLDSLDVKSKVILLITDGANNSGKLSPRDAARLAATLGIRIYTIGIGTPGNHPIPLPNGQIIWSGRDEFDEHSLQEIADIGGGKFFKGQDNDTLQNIFRTIDELEKSELESRKIVETKDAYFWFVVASLVFAILHLLWKQSGGRAAPLPA